MNLKKSLSIKDVKKTSTTLLQNLKSSIFIM